MNLQNVAQIVLDEIKQHPWYLTKSTVKALEEALAEKESSTIEKLDALAASWENTGERSISNRIRQTLQYCSDELRKIIA